MLMSSFLSDDKTTFNANINLEISPPEAILCNGAIAIPGFIDPMNVTLSVPCSLKSHSSN